MSRTQREKALTQRKGTSVGFSAWLGRNQTQTIEEFKIELERLIVFVPMPGFHEAIFGLATQLSRLLRLPACITNWLQSVHDSQWRHNGFGRQYVEPSSLGRINY